tara:strand:+ start:126 stop:299 length:174 start_codon:yes stop_codon:yes gene_type:complete
MKYAILNHLTGSTSLFETMPHLMVFLDELDPDMDDITIFKLKELKTTKVSKYVVIDN